MNPGGHIPDVAEFLREARRCFVPGGRVFIVDQHLGALSRAIFKHAHHELFDPDALRPSFDGNGPLGGANGALAWIHVQRGRSRTDSKPADLRIERYRPHTVVRCGLSGGLHRWSLLPDWSGDSCIRLDKASVGASRAFGQLRGRRVAAKRLMRHV
jgi:hypothetical protein